MTELDVGLWRSTLGETHPHHGFDVEMDFWPQSAHASALAYEGVAEYRVVGGLVACVSGQGGGSQKATFRRELVPILEGAVERWRAAAEGVPIGRKVDAFFDEVQRGFDSFEGPPWADQLEASASAAYVTPGVAQIACTGLERAFRLRGGQLAGVSARMSLLEMVPAADRASLDEEAARMWASMAVGHLGASSRPRDRVRPWQSVEVDLTPGDVLLLLSGDGGELDVDLIAEALSAAIAAAGKERVRAPKIARVLGELLSAPSRGRAPASEERERRLRWLVPSRVSLAVVRVVS